MNNKWYQKKWMLPVIIPLIIFILFNTFYSVPMLRNRVIQEKENQIRDLTEMGISILKHFHSMEEAGTLTRSQAQQQAASLIRDIRFGPEDRDYYWINDHEPTLIVHPFRTDLEGANLAAEDLQTFLELFLRFAAIAADEGEGFVRYDWQYYDEMERLEPKISYVKEFQPWGWIIGTGLYVNDVEKAARSQRNMNTIFVLTALQLFLAVVVVIRLMEDRQKKQRLGDGTDERTLA